MARFIPKHLLYSAAILGAAGLIAAGTFQNCAKVSFEVAPENLSSFGGPVSKTPQYAELKAGDDAFLPPLKMIFVVDNSGTMQANQINLSSSFAKLFEGANGKNLAPFDTTAYVFNTAQRSVSKSVDPKTYDRLPKTGIEDFGRLSSAELSAGPRAILLDGKVPGDLVGYRVLESSVDGLSTTSYLPAPVARFTQERGRTFASIFSHKSKDDSIAEFAQGFRDRIAVLDPARSAIDAQTKTGVLDSVIDNESGLCALARVMRHKEEFVKPGELAAFFVVTDEDDADPNGKNCIESISDQRGDENLVDGKCVTPRTTIRYRERNPNPGAANCTITYDSGFKYKYNYSVPQTALKYYLLQRDYKYRQTVVTYPYATGYKYAQPQVTLSYFTKAPTYKIPQSKIEYYRKVETCESYRDGNKFNCKYSYPKATTATFAQSFSNCRTFAQGKVPADALLDDPAYPLSCYALDPIAKSGACSSNDPNIRECNQNYSASRKTSAPIDAVLPANADACIAFANGKLESGAVLNDTGYTVTCADAGSREIVGNGFCPNNGFACTQSTATKSTSIDGLLGANTCLTFAKSKKSQLDANAIVDNAEKVSCVEGPGRTVTNDRGKCATLDASLTKDCIQHPASAQTSAAGGAQPAGMACLDFIKQTVGVSVVVDETAAVSCLEVAPAAKTSGEKTISFTNAAAESVIPTVNSNCLPALQDVISRNDGVIATSCTVTSLISADHAYNENVTCDQTADISRKCIAIGIAATHCRNPRSTQPGDVYQSTFSEMAGIEGKFTCESLCKDTNLCPLKSGTVAENYKDCSVQVADSERTFSRVPTSRATCNASESPRPVITKTYPPEVGSRTDYVAGSKSESNEANALANYIRDQAGASVQSVSVFVRQANDPTGVNGSTGRAYNTFVDLMGGGEKKSVLGSADAYASALESLGGVISQKLRRSFAIPLQGDQAIRRVWFRKAGSSAWGEPLAKTDYQVTGGTITLVEAFPFAYQDEFRFEYY